MSEQLPLEPGRAVRLSQLVQRVLAPNPGVMTGTGTNTYLVGDEQLVVIDPGPDDAGHLGAILAAAEGRPITAILVTHTHPDHWPGAAGLAARSGAPVMAFQERAGLQIDAALADGDRVAAGSVSLQAIHTPGHAGDHLCFWLERERLLFTGDQVMHGSTVVLWPPEGDLHRYLLSLERLLELAPARLAPGHGQPFDDPAAAIGAIIAHRRAREAKVVAALAAEPGPATVDDLLEAVYSDVEPRRLPIARGSLWAHLRALVDTGRASTDGYDDLEHGRWQLTGDRSAT